MGICYGMPGLEIQSGVHVLLTPVKYVVQNIDQN